MLIWNVSIQLSFCQVQCGQVTSHCRFTGALRFLIFGTSLTFNKLSLSSLHKTFQCLPLICVFFSSNLQWIKNEILAAKVHKLLPIVGFLLILVIRFWQLGFERPAAWVSSKFPCPFLPFFSPHRHTYWHRLTTGFHPNPLFALMFEMLIYVKRALLIFLLVLNLHVNKTLSPKIEQNSIFY